VLRSPIPASICVWLSALALAGSSCAEAEPDPLDPELLRPLATARGSGSGSAHAGGWGFGFDPGACDCPTVEVDDGEIDLCDLARLGSLGATISEASGLLAIEFPASNFGAYSGAIDEDGSFVVARIHDASTAVGPLTILGRLDGTFTSLDQAEGSAAQRLVGELLDRDVDCRWTTSFVSQRQ